MDGIGTFFRRERSSSGQSPDVSQITGSSLDHLNILIVNGSAPVMDLLHQAFDTDPRLIDVVVAANGREALVYADHVHFDCAIMDLGIADMDPMECLQKLAGSHLLPRVPVIAVSATENTNKAIAVMRAGAQDYLVVHKTDGTALARSVNETLARLERRRQFLAERT